MQRGIIISLLILFILLFGGIIVTYLSSMLLVSVRRTPKRVVDEILKLMKLEKDDRIIDLGSGDGRILITAVKQYNVKAVGYEISPILNLLFKFKKVLLLGKRHRSTKIMSTDFFKADLSDVDIIYCNLNEKALQSLFPKFSKEMEKDSRLFVYENKIDGIEPNAEHLLSNQKHLYVYSGNKFK